MAQTNKMIDKKQLALRLKEIRQVFGYSMMEVAVGTNMSESQIYNYEHCKSLPSLDSVIKLSLFYDITIDSILDGCICDWNL